MIDGSGRDEYGIQWELFCEWKDFMPEFTSDEILVQVIVFLCIYVDLRTANNLYSKNL